MNPTPLGRLARAAFALACGGFLFAPPVAHAQTVKPWMPATADSITVLSAEARARFRTCKGDSATGGNYEAYQLVSDLARKLVSRLGRANMLQAPAIETVLDSLGLDTDVRVDPEQTGMAFLLVRNPYRLSADGVGYLLWFRGSELRIQGVVFPPARNPRFRAWWSGLKETPYEAAVLFDRRRDAPEIGLRLFRMTQSGLAWNLVQFEADVDPGIGEAVFADLNGDSKPEVVAWSRVEPDSFLTLASGMPHMLNESLWTERSQGFLMHDVRLLPSPVATLHQFLRLLLAGKREGAERLLAHPERMADAVRDGWPLRRERGAWLVEYGESGQAWPEWLAVKERTPSGDRRWIFHFELQGGRWVVRDWLPVRTVSTPENTPISPRAEKKR